MYCSNCAKQINKDLKYCNHCGERLAKEAPVDKDGLPGKMLETVLTTLFFIVIFGLGILVGLVAVLLNNGVAPPAVVTIATAYIAAIFGICFVLVRQAAKLIDHRLKGSDQTHSPAQPLQMPSPTTAQLEEPRDFGIGSVIETTTRTLREPVDG